MNLNGLLAKTFAGFTVIRIIQQIHIPQVKHVQAADFQSSKKIFDHDSPQSLRCVRD